MELVAFRRIRPHRMLDVKASIYVMGRTVGRSQAESEEKASSRRMPDFIESLRYREKCNCHEHYGGDPDHSSISVQLCHARPGTPGMRSHPFKIGLISSRRTFFCTWAIKKDNL